MALGGLGGGRGTGMAAQHEPGDDGGEQESERNRDQDARPAALRAGDGAARNPPEHRTRSGGCCRLFHRREWDLADGTAVRCELWLVRGCCRRAARRARLLRLPLGTGRLRFGKRCRPAARVRGGLLDHTALRSRQLGSFAFAGPAVLYSPRRSRHHRGANLGAAGTGLRTGARKCLEHELAFAALHRRAARRQERLVEFVERVAFFAADVHARPLRGGRRRIARLGYFAYRPIARNGRARASLAGPIPGTLMRPSTFWNGPLRARSATRATASLAESPGTEARSSGEAVFTSMARPSSCRSRPERSRRGPASVTQPTQWRGAEPLPSGAQARGGSGRETSARNPAGKNVRAQTVKIARRRGMRRRSASGGPPAPWARARPSPPTLLSAARRPS